MIDDTRQPVVVYLNPTESDEEHDELKAAADEFCESNGLRVERYSSMLRLALSGRDPVVLCSLEAVSQDKNARKTMRDAFKAGKIVYAVGIPVNETAVPELFEETLRERKRQAMRDMPREVAGGGDNRSFRSQKSEAAIISSQLRSERADRAYNYIMPEVLKMQDEGKTLYQIADHLNETGRLTSIGQPWNISTLSRRIQQYKGEKPQLGSRKKPTRVTEQLKQLVVALSENGYTTASIARVLDMGYQTVSTIRRDNDVQPSHLGQLGGDLEREAEKALKLGMGVLGAAMKLNLPPEVLTKWAKTNKLATSKVPQPRQDAGLMTVGSVSQGDGTKGGPKTKDAKASTRRAGNKTTGGTQGSKKAADQREGVKR